jgi:PKD repeat protein
MKIKYFLFLLIFFVTNSFIFSQTKNNNEFFRKSKETITPIELNHNEVLNYQRNDGQILKIKLVSTSAKILYTNKHKIPSDESGADRGNMYRARLLYEYSCEVEINGHQMTMLRYVGSQESFFEPHVINGVRIWFIGVTDVFEEHGGFLNTARNANGIPTKNARFVLQDMEKRICPEEIYPWFIDGVERDENYIYKDNFIDIGRTFNGDDCFMGAYLAGESHGALDINLPQNSLMYAPFNLDAQENIRAEGIKKWPDGSEWRINTGHIIEKYVPDNTPVKGGQPYGLGARRGCWWHPHAHFGFQIFEETNLYEIDPWIIFWQLFEDNKKRDGLLRAQMEPLTHTKTGAQVKFKGVCNLNCKQYPDINYYWSFGDGGWSDLPSPIHIFSNPGIYPVTLTISKGQQISSFTQHITIEGKKISEPSILLRSGNEPTFRSRPIEAMDVYGRTVKSIPHTLDFLSRPSRPEPNTKNIQVNNLGGNILSPVKIGLDYRKGINWVNIKINGEGNNQILDVKVNGNGLSPGEYEAIISVHSEVAINSPQKFRVIMNIPEQPAKSLSVIVDDKDPGFYCTPYFWIGHRFHGWGWPELKNAEGYNNFYLINGQRARKDEFARFTPDLESGLYEIWLYEKTPFASGPPANNEPTRFKVRVVHSTGDTLIWMEPQKMKGFYPRPYKAQEGWAWLEPQESRKVGTFRFEEGKDGYFEILAEGSRGQIIVDAVRFLKMED